MTQVRPATQTKKTLCCTTLAKWEAVSMLLATYICFLVQVVLLENFISQVLSQSFTVMTAFKEMPGEDSLLHFLR